MERCGARLMYARACVGSGAVARCCFRDVASPLDIPEKSFVGWLLFAAGGPSALGIEGGSGPGAQGFSPLNLLSLHRILPLFQIALWLAQRFAIKRAWTF